MRQPFVFGYVESIHLLPQRGSTLVDSEADIIGNVKQVAELEAGLEWH